MTANTETMSIITSYESPFTYTYEVTGLKVKDEGSNTNAVVQTYWKLTGINSDGLKGTFSGATPFTSTTMPEGSTFVPFEELTEETVIGWIHGIVESNPGYHQHIDSQIQKQIADAITPVTEASLPWVPKANTETIIH